MTIVNKDIHLPCSLLFGVTCERSITYGAKSTDVTTKSPSFLLAKGAYVPEEGYATLDFSMPSYRVESDVQPINSIDLLGGGSTSSNADRSSSSSSSATAKKASSPSRAEKGALAVAQAKAKKEALKAEALAKQQELKGQAFVKSEATSD